MRKVSKWEHPTWINGRIHPFYEQWRGMHRRCKEILKPRNTLYKNCTICKEWDDYDIYFKWAKENYYEIPGERICLDKDILVKGNKIYSPEFCIFVPQRINQLFESSKASRGKYPLGISYLKNNDTFMVRMRKNGETVLLGIYNDIDEAFNKYKTEKEKYIKEIADEYKCKIPKELYEAMYNYKIEIKD